MSKQHVGPFNVIPLVDLISSSQKKKERMRERKKRRRKDAEKREDAQKEQEKKKRAKVEVVPEPEEFVKRKSLNLGCASPTAKTRSPTSKKVQRSKISADNEEDAYTDDVAQDEDDGDEDDEVKPRQTRGKTYTVKLDDDPEAGYTDDDIDTVCRHRRRSKRLRQQISRAENNPPTKSKEGLDDEEGSEEDDRGNDLEQKLVVNRTKGGR
ncbi:hypothetical protein C0991_007314, partial [Blastosporella zonata]